MRKEIHFKDGEFHHHIFIEDSIDKCLSPFDKADAFSVKCYVSTVTSRRNHKVPQFHCEMVIQPRQAAPIVIHKEAKNFYVTIRDACRAAEKALRRNSRIKLKERRRLSEKVTEQALRNGSPQFAGQAS